MSFYEFNVYLFQRLKFDPPTVKGILKYFKQVSEFVWNPFIFVLIAVFKAFIQKYLKAPFPIEGHKLLLSLILQGRCVILNVPGTTKTARSFKCILVKVSCYKL